MAFPLTVRSASWLVVVIASFAAVVVCGEEFVDRPVISIGNGIPRLHLVENFATDEEMDYIMKNAFNEMRPQNQKAETGMVHELPVATPILAGVYDRMQAIFPNIGNARADKASETFRVRRYLSTAIEGGDYHPPHTDWFEGNGPGDLTNVLIITMIVYLTSPEKGGETYFPAAWHNGKKGYMFQPKRGDLAVWWSCHNNGTQDFHSEHSSEPLLQGIKWNAARFFYDNVDKCAEPAAKTIKVPKAADSNVPMTNSSAVMFGTTFPEGVWATTEGTSTKGDVMGDSYEVPGEGEEGEDFEGEGAEEEHGNFDEEDYEAEEEAAALDEPKKKKKKLSVEAAMESEALVKQAEKEMTAEKQDL